MLEDWQQWLENFLPPLKEKRLAEKLALEIEIRIRELTGLAEINPENRDIITVLQSILLLLTNPSDRLLPEKPSVTAAELIRLRDWVLLAKNQEKQEITSPRVLEAIEQQLAEILATEGITTLEETGKFDYQKHRVVSTQPTDDPQQDEFIYATVRPGYLFKEQLLRPQDVIVYLYSQGSR